MGFDSLGKLCYLTNHRNILSVWVFYLIFAFFELQLRFNLFFWEVTEIIWIWILFIASVWIDLGSKFSVLIQVKLLSIEPASSYESLSGHASWWSVPTGTVSLWCCTLWIYMKSSVSGYLLCCIVCNLVLWGWTSSWLSDHVLWNMSIAIVYASLSMWFVFD